MARRASEAAGRGAGRKRGENCGKAAGEAEGEDLREFLERFSPNEVLSWKLRSHNQVFTAYSVFFWRYGRFRIGGAMKF